MNDDRRTTVEFAAFSYTAAAYHAITIAPTMQDGKQALAEWRKAEADASSAAAILDQALTLELHWQGPPVTEQLLNDVTALRSKADAKLRAAYKAMENRREALAVTSVPNTSLRPSAAT